MVPINSAKRIARSPRALLISLQIPTLASLKPPEPGQREDTCLTAFGLDKPDNFAYFIVQGNFNPDKGDTLGPKFAREIDIFLIFGGYSEVTLN